jgi:hypothetical protein
LGILTSGQTRPDKAAPLLITSTLKVSPISSFRNKKGFGVPAHQVLADFQVLGGTFAVEYNSTVEFGYIVITAPTDRIIIGAEVKLDTAADADQVSQIQAIVESDGSGIIIEAYPHDNSTFGTVNGVYSLNTAVQVELTV